MTPDEHDFWEPPKAQPMDDWEELGRRPLPGMPVPRPGVLTWFTVYCVLLALVYLLISMVMLATAILGPSAPNANEEDKVLMPIMAGGMALVCLVLGLGFGAAPFLPKRPWSWVYGIVLICLGMTSCCTLPACIPLLIYWLRPENRLFFGKEAA